MAFPSVDALIQQQFSTSSDPANVDLPSTVASGDLLLVLFAQNASGATLALSTPSGWTKLFEESEGSFIRLAIYGKVADGTEGGTSIALSNNGRTAVAQVYRISSWHGAIADVEVATGAHFTSGTTRSPPSLTPTWGADDTLWIAVASAADDDQAFSVYPASYTNGTSQVSGGGINNGCELASARRALNAATEDPGDFTLASTETWVLTTIAVRPAAGGGGTTYTQTVTGSITPSGSLTRTISKALSGAVTATGTITRTIRKALGGAVAASGAVTKTISKAFSGAITAAGTVTERLVVTLALSGSITATGSLSRTIRKLAAGSITAVGALTKKTSKALSGTVTATGALTKKVSKTLVGAITATGSLAELMIVTLATAGSITAAGVVSGVKTTITYIQSVTRRFSRYLRMLGRR